MANSINKHLRLKFPHPKSESFNLRKILIGFTNPNQNLEEPHQGIKRKYGCK